MASAEKNVSPATKPSACPCGSGRPFAECCEPLLEGKRQAATAEELMRARFSAHATGHFKFLHESLEETLGQPFVDQGEKPTTTWTRLAVHSHEKGSDADTAYVDFSAYGTEDGKEVVLHEKALFHRVKGRWLYRRAVRLGPAPVKAAPKVGRNDPCPCGSGKKYKQCCLA